MARLLSLSEASASLGVTAATLRQQIARGSLHAQKVGSIWTLTQAEVERYRRENLGRRIENRWPRHDGGGR